MTDTTRLIQRRNRFLGAGAALFYESPVHIVRGEGVNLYDPDGRRYVDMYNNVPSVGHCHPHVVEAVARQVATLNVHSRYLNEGIVDYAERLVTTHHAGIESVVFTCTGTEANEVALMMARTATGGRGIVCTDAAYHGNSSEIRKLTRKRIATGEVRSMPFPETYRFAGNDATAHFLDELKSVLTGFEHDRIPFAGLMLCPILANEGLPEIPAGFMKAAADVVHAAGGLLIADEVQAGLCRTGRWWGYEYMDCVPDIVTMGKPLGAGVPLAGAAASRKLVETFRREYRYFNTFASTPLQAAAGNAVLDVIESEHLCEHVAQVGSWLHARLTPLQQRCPAMGDLRSKGLFFGMEWVEDRQRKTPDRHGAVRVVNALKDKGYLISNAGIFENVLKLRPPLVFSETDGEGFLTAFEETLGELGYLDG
jgi:4-aminobutyrate aminotransferase-like enzyme